MLHNLPWRDNVYGANILNCTHTRVIKLMVHQGVNGGVENTLESNNLIIHIVIITYFHNMSPAAAVSRSKEVLPCKTEKNNGKINFGQNSRAKVLVIAIEKTTFLVSRACSDAVGHRRNFASVGVPTGDLK